MRDAPAKPPDHGEGAERLAQIVQGEADDAVGASREQRLQAPAEPRKERVPLRRLGRPEQVGAAQGGEVRVVIVGEGEPPAGGGAQGAIQVADGASVAVDVPVAFGRTEQGQVLAALPEGAPRPGVSGWQILRFQQVQQSLEICVENLQRNPAPGQGAGERGDPRRGLARLGKGRMDQQHGIDLGPRVFSALRV
ncbi:MAG: hypothetical protein A4E73_03149 [Syntrophaceae bacterium PtaU1.Bin231]|nr:MAG: hypothetical protein A4E73_03149 [Syntrophaceae bacterium PtaU1.Bin231]